MRLGDCFTSSAAASTFALLSALLAPLACNTSKATHTQPPAPAASASALPERAREPEHAPLADERKEIPGGAFNAGSMPGERGRVPELEPRVNRVELGPFEIDRLPYPNDPGKPPLVSVAREEAKRMCAERGERLCTELEWERACKGEQSDMFAGGQRWDPRCAKEPRHCASGFDVLALGSLREWVASDVVPGSREDARRAVVRGASPDAPEPQHRCAQRSGIEPETKSTDLGFRCCRGAPNAAVVAEPKLGEAFVRAKVSAAELAKLLGADERTRALAADLKLFREPDAANTVVDRGPGDRKGFSFTVLPLIWNPVAGAEYMIATGRAGNDTSFVVAFHVLGANEYKLAASFTMKNEPGPVALAYSGSIRPRLHFSTCWGCPGETGKILYRDPDSVLIAQP